LSGSILIGVAPEGPQALSLKRANRHGLIAGATGTGKTVTLQTFAEQFAKAGVCVFAADVKGDLSGISAPGQPPPAWAAQRAAEIKLENHQPEAAPVVFWDIYGREGHPVRTTVTEMGPVLMSRILDCSPAQEGAMTVAFRLADEEGLALLDLKDLRALLIHISENADEIGKRYGLVSPTTIAALQRRLLQLEMDGAEIFFGEPALELADMIRAMPDGRGVVNILSADKLVQSPRLYSTFLLWLLSELWESLPEVGDLEKPKLVFFFDEAHLLFNDASKELLDRVEQIARLIRSKGVGIYFVSQSPCDVPDMVLSQLGNRIQHAMRAYIDVAREIQELHVGEALVSVLDDKGAPTPVARTLVRPPVSRVGPLTPHERQTTIDASPLARKYAKAIDRESAYEILAKRAQKAAKAEAKMQQRGTTAGTRRRSSARTAERDGGLFHMIARELIRGIFGTPRRRRRR
jgi:DNA helicase HerA-like ATPase